MISLTPFLLFDGNCAEAMAFYQSCLGGDLTLTKIADTPMKNQMPPGQHHKVAHAHLNRGAIEMYATASAHPTPPPALGSIIAIYISDREYQQLTPLFDSV